MVKYSENNTIYSVHLCEFVNVIPKQWEKTCDNLSKVYITFFFKKIDTKQTKKSTYFRRKFLDIIFGRKYRSTFYKKKIFKNIKKNYVLPFEDPSYSRGHSVGLRVVEDQWFELADLDLRWDGLRSCEGLIRPHCHPEMEASLADH